MRHVRISGGAYLAVSLLTLCTAPAFAQNLLTTFAGGDWVYPRTPISALNAPLGSLSSLALAPNGDLLVADVDNAIIVRVTPEGIASVVAGNGISGYSGDGGPAISASLRTPEVVVADQKGNIYIGDSAPAASGSNLTIGVIRKISTDGTITTFATVPDEEYADALAVDTAGNLYVAGSSRVWRYAADGSAIPYAGQVNTVVPAGAPSGDAVPVSITVAGQTSPAATIAIR